MPSKARAPVTLPPINRSVLRRVSPPANVFANSSNWLFTTLSFSRWVFMTSPLAF
jgi:hypothetical protein